MHQNQYCYRTQGTEPDCWILEQGGPRLVTFTSIKIFQEKAACCVLTKFLLAYYLRNKKHELCFCWVMETWLKVWENGKCCISTILLNCHSFVFSSIETKNMFSISFLQCSLGAYSCLMLNKKGERELEEKGNKSVKCQSKVKNICCKTSRKSSRVILWDHSGQCSNLLVIDPLN